MYGSQKRVSSKGRLSDVLQDDGARMCGSHKRVGPKDLIHCGGDDRIHGVHLKGRLLVVTVGLVVQADTLGAGFREDEAILAPGPGRPDKCTWTIIIISMSIMMSTSLQGYARKSQSKGGRGRADKCTWSNTSISLQG